MYRMQNFILVKGEGGEEWSKGGGGVSLKEYGHGNCGHGFAMQIVDSSAVCVGLNKL